MKNKTTNRVDKIERRRYVQAGFNIGRFGCFAYARNYSQYNEYMIVPGISVAAVNGYDLFLDVEIKILCFGVGIRFIWIKQK